MSELSHESIQYVREFVFRHSAIAMDADKAYLIESRLKTLAQKERIGSLGEIVDGLRNAANDSLHQKVIEVMTTNETSFFRDMHLFDAMRETILPEIQARSPGPVHIWSAACSSGQEAYSLLMLMDQHHQLLARRTQLLATDLSNEMVVATKAGRYSQLEVNRGLPAALIPAYFERQGLRWQVSNELRKRIEARTLNLAEPLPTLPKMDVVLLRNVLIYFDLPTKKRVLGQIKRVMNPEGVLFLGAAETTLNIDPDFQRVQYNNAHCYKLR